MTLWSIIIGMGVITYALRLSFIVLMERMALPLVVRRALRFVPPAVLSAIVFPEVLQADSILGNPRLMAAALATFVAWRTQNVLLTIGAGMAALWISQAWIF